MLRNCCTGRGFWLLLAVTAFAGVVFVISRQHRTGSNSLSLTELYKKFKANANKGNPKFNKYAGFTQGHENRPHSNVNHHHPNQNDHHRPHGSHHPQTYNNKHHQAPHTDLPHHHRSKSVVRNELNHKSKIQIKLNAHQKQQQYSKSVKKQKSENVRKKISSHPQNPPPNNNNFHHPRESNSNFQKKVVSITTFSDVAKENTLLLPGGKYKPRQRPKQKVAIIIPYRKRKFQLRMLLHHLHPILQKQNLEYGIFVINQADKGYFNRAKLLNAGYKEVLKLDNSYQCFIFHNVNLLPEDYRCSYTCSDGPRHISTAISHFEYRYSRRRSMEGVSAFTPNHFRHLNGWSFERWPEEEMVRRTRKKHLKLWRTSTAICRFTSLPDPPKQGRSSYHGHNSYHRSRMHNDGLNSTHYKHITTQAHATYTNITVELL